MRRRSLVVPATGVKVQGQGLRAGTASAVTPADPVPAAVPGRVETPTETIVKVDRGMGAFRRAIDRSAGMEEAGMYVERISWEVWGWADGGSPGAAMHTAAMQ
jgi:hypothetical protein